MCEASWFSAARFSGLVPIRSEFVRCDEEENPSKRAKKKMGGAGPHTALLLAIWSSLKKSLSAAEAEQARRSGSTDGEFEPAQERSGKPPQELAEVRPGGGEHRVDGITRQSRQEAPIHPVITLEVTDLRLDRATSSPPPPFRP